MIFTLKQYHISKKKSSRKRVKSRNLASFSCFAFALVRSTRRIHNKIEELNACKTPEERYQERQKQSKPLIDALFEWLHSLENKVDRKSLIGDAILYTLGQETYLRRYLEDGHIPIDNNDCERALKRFAVGRRNWLFAKSIKGAEASAVIYSITESAMLNELRPYHYLFYVLDTMRRLPDFPDEDQIRALLPWSPSIPEECRIQ